MGERICAVEGCDRAILARLICSKHYQSAKKTGTLPPLPLRVPGPTLENLLTRIRVTDDCWYWVGPITEQGYGRAFGGKAHRKVYEAFVGPIPYKMTLDHECHNRDLACPGGDTCPHRRCVRPDHLIPRPIGENVARGRGGASTRAKVTHCPHGHLYDEQNTAMNTKGIRRCRACARIRSAIKRQGSR